MKNMHTKKITQIRECEKRSSFLAAFTWPRPLSHENPFDSFSSSMCQVYTHIWFEDDPKIKIVGLVCPNSYAMNCQILTFSWNLWIFYLELIIVKRDFFVCLSVMFFLKTNKWQWLEGLQFSVNRRRCEVHIFVKPPDLYIFCCVIWGCSGGKKDPWGFKRVLKQPLVV